MLKRVIDWLDERIRVRDLWNGFSDRTIPGGASWFYVLGASLLFIFTLQMATGILLAMYYVPTPDHAYASVKFIQNEAPFGSFVRGLHHWGASFMMVIVALHMLRVFIFGSYKKPREVVWLIGVGLIALVGGFAFTGYLLPWDQKAYWATVVGTNVAGTVPVVGGTLLRIVRGGTELGALSLSRFFAIHTYILPWSLALLAGLHVFLLERAGAGGNWNADRMPSKAEPLFPNQIFRDTLFILVVFLSLASLAVLVPAPLEPQADPTDSTYNPRPEWYFYFVFQMLRVFEGKFELIGTVILPGLAGAVLMLIPFLDRGPERDPARRKLMMAAAALAVVTVVALTIAGARAPIVNEPAVTSPSVLAGRAIFARSGCSACHSISGKGGTIGPDLTHVANRRPDAEWHLRHFKDPQAVVPGSIMPKVDLSDKELRELADYMLSLK
jgi:ubiquinol-cytochrome c reductase cytochrome b subunit